MAYHQAIASYPLTDASGARLATALTGHRVLIVYGLLGEVGAALRPLGVDYMGTQAAWLRDHTPAAVAVVRLPTGAPIAENAARLRAILINDPRPAVVVAHSKGGLEALAALVDPTAAAYCAALITIQTPFYGSLVADAVVGTRPLHFAAGAALRAIRRGSALGLRDLSTAARTAWMTSNAAGIVAAVRAIPMVCCASSVDIAVTGPDRRYLPLVRWMQRRGGGANDGLVSIASALLPGARHVVVAGTHRGLTAKGAGRDPVGLLRHLLELALLDHASLDHASLNHASLDHASLDHASLDHASLNHLGPDQAGHQSQVA